MTFADLLTTLETRGALTASRVKDCGTSIKYLAAPSAQPAQSSARSTPPAGMEPRGRKRWRPTSPR